jgi:hypothetical protein
MAICQYNVQKKISNDDMAIYLHRYRPIGLQDEDTYFNKIANLLCQRVREQGFSLYDIGYKREIQRRVHAAKYI